MLAIHLLHDLDYVHGDLKPGLHDILNLISNDILSNSDLEKGRQNSSEMLRISALEFVRKRKN